jgi:WD40 repeat protein
MIKFIYSLFFISFCAFAMQPQQKMLTVETSDKKILQIPEKYLLSSIVIKKVLKKCSDSDNPIPLPNISSSQFSLVRKFLKNSFILQDKSASTILRQAANAEFSDLNTQEKLYSVLCAANYLNEPNLLEKCMELWAQKKYSPTKQYPLPLEINMEIAKKMDRLQKLVNNTAQWVAYDLEKEQTSFLVKTYEPAMNSIWANDFSKNGKFLVGGHRTGEISLYNLETDVVKIIQSGHPQVSLVKFNANDTQIWSCGEDSTIKIWDVNSGSHVGTFESPLCRSFIFGHIPQYKLLIADGIIDNLCVWNLGDKKKGPEFIDAHSESILFIEPSRDGSLFVSGGRDKNIKVWNSATRKLAGLFTNTSSGMSGCFGNNNKLVCGLENGTVVLYDLEKGSKLSEAQEHDAGIWSVLYADEKDNLLCSGAKDTLIKLWDIRTKNPIITLRDHRDEIQFMAINQNKGLLSSASHDQSMKVWDLRKLSRPIKTLREEFSQRTTIEQILLLEEADKNETPLDMEIFNRKNVFQKFSCEAQKLLFSKMNIKNQNIN